MGAEPRNCKGGWERIISSLPGKLKKKRSFFSCYYPGEIKFHCVILIFIITRLL